MLREAGSDDDKKQMDVEQIAEFLLGESMNHTAYIQLFDEDAKKKIEEVSIPAAGGLEDV